MVVGFDFFLSFLKKQQRCNAVKTYKRWKKNEKRSWMTEWVYKSLAAITSTFWRHNTWTLSHHQSRDASRAAASPVVFPAWISRGKEGWKCPKRRKENGGKMKSGFHSKLVAFKFIMKSSFKFKNNIQNEIGSQISIFFQLFLVFRLPPIHQPAWRYSKHDAMAASAAA